MKIDGHRDNYEGTQIKKHKDDGGVFELIPFSVIST